MHDTTMPMSVFTTQQRNERVVRGLLGNYVIILVVQ